MTKGKIGVLSHEIGEYWVKMGDKTMFTGKYQHIIDDNNRLAIPSPLRKCIDEKIEGKGFYITPGLDKCLAVYPPRQFNELTRKLGQLMFTNQKARNFQRLFFSKSSGLVTCDKQGRIIIPQILKEHAGLEKEVAIIGVMNKIEMWDLKCWNEFETDHERSFEEEAEDLFKLGFALNPGQNPPIPYNPNNPTDV
ncbi:MAG: division/cell wall cluster transcriptional repressor MraZ [Candidatus Scalinduaceae bacterium]